MSMHRYLALGLLAASLLAIVSGYVLLLHPEVVPWCAKSACLSQRLALGLAKPLYRCTWPLPLLFLGMVFVDRAAFYAWLRLFGVLSIGAICLIAAAEPVQTGFFPGPFPDRTGMTLVASVLVTVVSGAFILVRYAKAWRRNRSSVN